MDMEVNILEQSEKGLSYSRDKLFSNQKLKRVVSPLQKNQFKLDEISTASNKRGLFSPQRTKTPLMQNFKVHYQFLFPRKLLHPKRTSKSSI